uniref:Uncharacterized protein n=1 Tax=Anguilla anguilla TaxID=7936 RepID=A0A0E9XLF3_ANGAN
MSLFIFPSEQKNKAVSLHWLLCYYSKLFQYYLFHTAFITSQISLIFFNKKYFLNTLYIFFIFIFYLMLDLGELYCFS